MPTHLSWRTLLSGWFCAFRSVYVISLSFLLSVRHVGAAVGLSGYRLRDAPPFAHPNVDYFDSNKPASVAAAAADGGGGEWSDGRMVAAAALGVGSEVHVLGGVMGVAYR